MEYLLVILISSVFGIFALSPGWMFDRWVERLKISKGRKLIILVTGVVVLYSFVFYAFYLIPASVQNILGLEEKIPGGYLISLVFAFGAADLFYWKVLGPWLNKRLPPFRRALEGSEKEYTGKVSVRYMGLWGFTFSLNEWRHSFRANDCDKPLVEEWPFCGKKVIVYAKDTLDPTVKKVSAIFSGYSVVRE